MPPYKATNVTTFHIQGQLLHVHNAVFYLTWVHGSGMLTCGIHSCPDTWSYNSYLKKITLNVYVGYSQIYSVHAATTKAD